jgi:uncharacterized protein YdcH (DUF465 family)
MTPLYLIKSEEAGHISQELLFDQAPFTIKAPESNFSIPSSFYKKGYSLHARFDSLLDAHNFLYDFVANIKTQNTAFTHNAVSRMQLAKLDLIPLCHEITSTGFQALHWDMGQPFVDDQPQTMYTVGALYRPLGERNPLAKTRLVSLDKLFKQKQFGTTKQVKQDLLHYVERYGDGWTHPEPVNTKRIACFARILDSFQSPHQLCEEKESMIGQCFSYDDNKDGGFGLQQEQNFFLKAGIDLSSIEEQIEIKPGQMLIYDNLRIVHGRIGERQPKELFNFLFGIKKASYKDIDAFTSWLTNKASN